MIIIKYYIYLRLENHSMKHEYENRFPLGLSLFLLIFTNIFHDFGQDDVISNARPYSSSQNIIYLVIYVSTNYY